MFYDYIIAVMVEGEGTLWEDPSRTKAILSSPSPCLAFIREVMKLILGTSGAGLKNHDGKRKADDHWKISQKSCRCCVGLGIGAPSCENPRSASVQCCFSSTLTRPLSLLFLVVKVRQVCCFSLSYELLVCTKSA